MSPLSSYDPYKRYRQRFLQRMAGLFTVLFVLGLSFAIGYWFGQQSLAHNLKSLQQQVQETRSQRDNLQDAITNLGAEAKSASMRLEQLQEEYQETVPEGPVEDIFALVRQQIEEGSDPERLAFLIRSGRPPQNCSEPEIRRFVISTPAYTGPDSHVGIADDAIMIKGFGSSAKNEKGEAEAWYDPSKPVTLSFTVSEGEEKKKTGVMPLHHTLVVGEREYRFTIESGARSFAKVTFDSCDYP